MNETYSRRSFIVNIISIVKRLLKQAPKANSSALPLRLYLLEQIQLIRTCTFTNFIISLRQLLLFSRLIAQMLLCSSNSEGACSEVIYIFNRLIMDYVLEITKGCSAT